MKVLMLNGGWRRDSNTRFALEEIGRTLSDEGIEFEIFDIGSKPIRDCIGCGGCSTTGRCVVTDDGVNEFLKKAAEADGFVFGSPVYYAHPAGRVLSFMDRTFYACKPDVFAHKPAAAVAVARRGGTTATLDVMQKHFTIAQMITVGSTYWNMIHGTSRDQLAQDGEGMQTMRNIAHNMAWLLKCIDAGRSAGVGEPTVERGTWTNFIR